MKSFSPYMLVLCFSSSACAVPMTVDGDPPSEAVGGTQSAFTRTFRTNVHCSFPSGLNGPVASIQGTLAFDRARYGSGAFPTTGNLRVELRAQLNGPGTRYGNLGTDTAIAGDGSSADTFVNDAHGAPVYTIEMHFDGNPTTIVHTTTGATFTSTCSGPLDVPAGGDLVAGYGMHAMAPNPDGTVELSIDVQNIGNRPVTAPNLRVSVAGRAFDATLYSNVGAPPGFNTLAAGERSNILVHEVPSTLVSECNSYPVVLDTDHRVQFGQPDPFGNDSRSVTVPCPLRWSTPITAQRLGADPPAWLANKTLGQIVNSQISGRPDNALCSSCHFAGAPHAYGPNTSLLITPMWLIGGQTWNSGWAVSFLQQSIKPQPLKDAFSKWRNDGALP